SPRRDAGGAQGNDGAIRAQIERSVERVFCDHVDAATHEAVERGEWPQRLWRAVEDAGFAAATARAAHAGIEAGWADAWPILRGLGHSQVPPPPAGTMTGAVPRSRAGGGPRPGPIARAGPGLDRRVA